MKGITEVDRRGQRAQYVECFEMCLEDKKNFFIYKHSLGNLENIHTQSSFMKVKHNWNSHSTMYLDKQMNKKHPPIF